MVRARTQLIINQSINYHHNNTKHSVPIKLQHALRFYSQVFSKCAPTIPIFNHTCIHSYANRTNLHSLVRLVSHRCRYSH